MIFVKDRADAKRLKCPKRVNAGKKNFNPGFRLP